MIRTSLHKFDLWAQGLGFASTVNHLFCPRLKTGGHVLLTVSLHHGLWQIPMIRSCFLTDLLLCDNKREVLCIPRCLASYRIEKAPRCKVWFCTFMMLLNSKSSCSLFFRVFSFSIRSSMMTCSYSLICKSRH